MHLANLQAEHSRWLAYNFPDQQPWQALLGMGEELGEIYHAYLKHSQGIRGVDGEVLMEQIQDGVGDLVIFLCGFCTNMGISLDEVVEATWHQVKKRDWQSDPLKAGE